MVKKLKRNSNGFTLTELLAVLLVLGIIASIAVPTMVNIIRKSKEDVCHHNAMIVEGSYETFLDIHDQNHSDVRFEQFLLDNSISVCPIDGDIKYVDGEVRCTLHPLDGGEKEDDDVPYL